MVVIPPGRFRMGDLSGEGDDDGKPVHDVHIGYSFAVGKFEVTQKQWRAVMGRNPSKFRGDNWPVDSVSWNDVQGFIANLNARTGEVYRLLSEAEWEYAARRGGDDEISLGRSF